MKPSLFSAVRIVSGIFFLLVVSAVLFTVARNQHGTFLAQTGGSGWCCIPGEDSCKGGYSDAIDCKKAGGIRYDADNEDACNAACVGGVTPGSAGAGNSSNQSPEASSAEQSSAGQASSAEQSSAGQSSSAEQASSVEQSSAGQSSSAEQSSSLVSSNGSSESVSQGSSQSSSEGSVSSQSSNSQSSSSQASQSSSSLSSVSSSSSSFPSSSSSSSSSFFWDQGWCNPFTNVEGHGNIYDPDVWEEEMACMNDENYDCSVFNYSEDDTYPKYCGNNTSSAGSAASNAASNAAGNSSANSAGNSSSSVSPFYLCSYEIDPSHANVCSETKDQNDCEQDYQGCYFDNNTCPASCEDAQTLGLCCVTRGQACQIVNADTCANIGQTSYPINDRTSGANACDEGCL